MATSYHDAGDRAVSIGRIFSRAFGTMGSNPLATFGIAFLLGALPQLLVNALLREVRVDVAQEVGIAGTLALGLVSLAIWITLAMAVQGALVAATTAYDRGRTAGIGECLLTGLRASLPLFGLALLQSIGLMIGFALLVVPGVFLMVLWAVTAPALVDERLGVFAAFGRSGELTRGARWKVLGAGLVFLFLYLLAASAFSAMEVAILGARAMVADAQHPFGVVALLNLVLATVSVAFWSTTQTSLYIELRGWKEGPRTERLSEIFA